MTIKKTLVLVGSIMILGVGLIAGTEKSQKQAQNAGQEQIVAKAQTRWMFVDQNGDGICDYARDHDNDGIPNGQDPDWTRPKDGTGYKNRSGNHSYAYENRNRNRHYGGNTWNNQSFRQNSANFGNRICDGTGPKGKGSRGSRS